MRVGRSALRHTVQRMPKSGCHQGLAYSKVFVFAFTLTLGSGVSLEGCDVSSETGSGVVGEGADIRVTGCKVHGCKTHGVAIYGDLLGEFGGGTVEGCEIYDNKEDGVLLRGGAKGIISSRACQMLLATS